MPISVVLLAVAIPLYAPTAVAADRTNLTGGRSAKQLARSQKIRDLPDWTLAKIVPGHTRKSEVEALLGRPWRDTELGDEDTMPGDSSVDVWEYRGQGAQGAYRVHIQFDKSDITTLIAKIPEKTGRAVARVAQPVVRPTKP